MFGILRLIRGAAGFVFAMQIVGLVPIFTWIAEPSAVTGAMMANVLLKVVAALIFGGMFFWLRGFINRRHEKKFGVPHPSLAKKRLAL